MMIDILLAFGDAAEGSWTPLSARRLGAFPAPKSVIRTTERQPKPLRLQGQSRYHGYHGFQLKWMTTTWSLRTFLKCAFHGFSRPSMHFSGWMWAVLQFHQDCLSFFICLWKLLCLSLVMDLTISHWQQGRHLGILIHDDQRMGRVYRYLRKIRILRSFRDKKHLLGPSRNRIMWGWVKTLVPSEPQNSW